MEKDKITFLDQNEQFLLENILFLRQLIKKNKASPNDYHQLAISYYLLKNYEKSLEITEQIIQKFPDYIDINRVFKLKILCLVQLQKYNEAIEIIKKRLYYNQNDTSLLQVLAYSYEKLNKFKDSILIHKRILEIDPENASSLNSYGYLLTIYGNPSTLSLAGKCIEKALKKKPENPPYLDSYAMYLYKIGKKEKAKEFLLKALQKDPSNPEILLHLKEVLNNNKK